MTQTTMRSLVVLERPDWIIPDKQSEIVQCYTGTFTECIEYMKRGYYLSVSGYILKQDSEEVRKCLREGILSMVTKIPFLKKKVTRLQAYRQRKGSD